MSDLLKAFNSFKLIGELHDIKTKIYLICPILFKRSTKLASIHLIMAQCKTLGCSSLLQCPHLLPTSLPLPARHTSNRQLTCGGLVKKKRTHN